MNTSHESRDSAWRPTLELTTLRQRAALLSIIRTFFGTRGVLEVETPVLGQFTVTDPHVESFVITGVHDERLGFLQTSPEFAMKRLLAAGSGSIYQICKAFRAIEIGRWHNPEFTMLEWYRPGFDHHRLMGEVEALVGELRDFFTTHHLKTEGIEDGENLSSGENAALYSTGADSIPQAYRSQADQRILRENGSFPRLSYTDVFTRFLEVDIDTTPTCALQRLTHQIGYVGTPLERDNCFELLLNHILRHDFSKEWVFIYDYPITQAALARIGGDPPRAERFELFYDGVELANGFHELSDSAEQKYRFETDIAIRHERSLSEIHYDMRLLGALDSGLPPCAGVALGLDRLFAFCAGLKGIEEVLTFSWPYA